MPEQAAPEGTLLAFDFGLRRIGVAVGQTATGTSSPLVTLRSSATKAPWQEINALIGEWRPCALVVGLPLDGDGKETDMSRAARRFGGGLEKRYGVPVYYMDERLTSRQAEDRFAGLRAGGLARRKDARKLDAMAAKIILENWLQSLPAAGP